MTFFFSERPADFAPKAKVATCWCEWQGRVLMLQTSKKKYGAGCWGPPGGKLNFGEEPIDAIVRETIEETGICLDPQQLETIGGYYMRTPFDFHFYLFRTAFSSDPGPLAINPEEHTAGQWVPFDEIAHLPLLPGAQGFLNLISSLRR